MYVVKESGEKERFMPEKLMRTLARAGVSNEIARNVVKEIKGKLYDGITTRVILQLALNKLKRHDPISGARYDLKRAIMNLGPTGFPFERYFAELLKHHGYKVSVGRIFHGNLVSHEIDVCAKKDKTYMIECKYHNAPGIYTSIKVALYVYARFLDLKNKFDVPWLATNTKFSNKVEKYARGIGMKLTSWQYPKNESLQDLIENKNLYPITILKSVDESVKGKLSQANIMLVLHLLDRDIKELKRRTKLPENILKKVVDEAKGICFKDGQNKCITKI